MRDLIAVPSQEGRPVPSLRERLTGVPEDKREAIVLELVREQAAAVLGYPSAADVEADRALQEMGLDSLGAVELRNHLAAAAGTPVPMLALTNHPTPAGIAKYLATQLNSSGRSQNSEGVESPSSESDSTTDFVALLGKASEEQKLTEFMEVLTVASSFRETFDGPRTVGKLPQPVRLAEGSKSSSLVLLSSAGPMSGPHEYVKLAKAFDESRDVFALPLPGFIAGELLPSNVRALVEVYAEVLAHMDLTSNYVLAGHSSGGWVAHALAGHLESAGVGPAAVVLLDTYLPQSPILRRILPSMLGSIHDAAGEGAVTDDARLTALGGYSRIFASWGPVELATPTLMVRPAEGGESDDSAFSWKARHSEIEVPGNHFTMVNEHATTTAVAVWDEIDAASN